MKKEIVIAAIPMLMFVLLTPVLAATQNSIIPAYGVIKYEYSNLKIGIYTESWNFAEHNATTITDSFDMSQSWWVESPKNYYNTKMDEVHAINPDYKFLIYRTALCIYDYWEDEWNYAASQGWLLKDINGNYVINNIYSGNYIVDITNPAYQQWLGAKVSSWLTQFPAFDGVMMDNSLKYSAQEFDAGCETRPINPRTGTYFTDIDIWDGCAGVLNAIIDAVGPSKLVLPNGIWRGSAFWKYSGYQYVLSKVPRLNAIGSEGIFYQSYGSKWYTETDWLQSVDMVVWIQDNILKDHPDRRFNGWVPLEGMPTDATPEQLMKFGFCSMMLGAKHSGQNTIGFGRITDATLLPLMQKLRSLSIGEPSSDYYKLSPASVYARDFAGGKVLVNPTGASFTVTLDANYTTFDGNAVSGSLTISSHTGIILTK